MQSKLLVVVGGLMLVSACVSANAAERFKAKSGSSVTIGFLGAYNSKSCGSIGKSYISFKQPSHGKLSARWTKGRNVDAGVCTGRLINGYSVTYKSERGFRGKDSGVVLLRFPEWQNGRANKSKNYSVIIEVR